MNVTPFATHLRAALAEADLTQGEFAKLIGTSTSAVSHYVSGRRIPRIETAHRIADALGVGLDALCYSGQTATAGRRTSWQRRCCSCAAISQTSPLPSARH